MGIFDALRGMLGESKVAKAFEAFGAARRKPAILFDGEGLALVLDPSHPDDVTPALSWSEVKTVTAFKRDLLAVDLICPQFEGLDGRVFEVYEEMAGWPELVAALPTHLPGCLTETAMLERVMQPPFAANETVIFRRS
jgi:hypothetical protein